MRLRYRTLLAAAVAALFVATSCTAATSEAATDCRADEELLDTRSFHVLDADEASFDVHPPTSGPHTSYVPDSGMHDDPVPEAEQVAALEQGGIVVNYADSISDAQLDALRGLARSKDVVVTPAPVEIDDGRPIALTSWGIRRLCESVSLVDARAFVREYAGRVGGHT